MNTDNKTYKKYAAGRAKKSPILKNCASAFASGGAICAAGHGLRRLFIYAGLSDDNAGMLTSSALILIAVLLTGFGVFDTVAKHTGAGTLVPITGFANAVASSAIDSRTEGLVPGIGAKIFTVAGPVLVWGISAGAVWGIVYFLVGAVFMKGGT
ncbi:MAG: SpoVA/SpoVAEb family sporulation membrane protein [Clostridia bacterium]|nr:SpoVA/SpoVAEb family sporulation membrane protein [Clostridia bacterium]